MLKNMMMNTILGASLLASVITVPTTAHAGAKAVLELFTSQGCSSCPPADKLAGELAKNPDLVVLTLPVTYWDYLGWKDTFGQKAFTNRQYNYAALRGDRSVYTPQIVVNGKQHAVGSDANKVAALVAANPLPVSVDIKPAGDDVLIEVGEGDSIEKGTVWMVLFQQKGTVAISRGENKNHKITYTNIVKEMRPLGSWQNEAMKIRFEKPDLMSDEVNGFAIIVQAKHQKVSSKILGAAAWVNDARGTN